ncbi:trypsin-like serine peptidase [Streptacidiphilus anmyonensis]|uniref:trypsin-like serine peptidase n=1 Tax=Streptacidiphilus anmyonensis TaxID=405782 RepID=UPI0005A91080|nr:trypsin-like serine protease [Streptacidiphilus anmyonensis]
MRKPGNTRRAVAMAAAAVLAAVGIATSTGRASASAHGAVAADPTNTFSIAFQGNTADLWDSGGTAPGSFDTGLGMAPGTSPSTALGGCDNGAGETAFQANTTNLWITGNGHSTDTHLGMMRGTSPSISSVCEGRGTNAYWTAFQANTTNLWITGNGHSTDTHLGMMRGTSPSIVAHLDAFNQVEYDVAFQANNGDLWRYNSETGQAADLHLGMLAGTSPSIASAGGSDVEIAFQANTGDLWITPGTTAGTDLGLGMMRGTSPSITRNFNNSSHFGIAFQANTGNLWITPAARGAGTNLGLGMMRGTSPSYTVKNLGLVPEIAFQANTGRLWVTPDKRGGGVSTGLSMAPGTSPSIMALGFTPSDGGSTFTTSGEPTVGKLYYDVLGYKWNCTGTVIGRDIVATAGHCIYNDFRDASGFSWAPPGLWVEAPPPYQFVPNDNSAGPHAAWHVTGQPVIPLHWARQHAPDADFGVYTIAPRSDGAHIGDVVGIHPWRVSKGVSAGSTPTYTIGYPHDFKDPQACNAPAIRFNGDNSQLELSCTFADGASGGPLSDRAGFAYANIGGFQQGGVNSFPSYGVVWNREFLIMVLTAEQGGGTVVSGSHGTSMRVAGTSAH